MVFLIIITVLHTLTEGCVKPQEIRKQLWSSNESINKAMITCLQTIIFRPVLPLSFLFLLHHHLLLLLLVLLLSAMMLLSAVGGSEASCFLRICMEAAEQGQLLFLCLANPNKGRAEETAHAFYFKTKRNDQNPKTNGKNICM